MVNKYGCWVRFNNTPRKLTLQKCYSHYQGPHWQVNSLSGPTISRSEIIFRMSSNASYKTSDSLLRNLLPPSHLDGSISELALSLNVPLIICRASLSPNPGLPVCMMLWKPAFTSLIKPLVFSLLPKFQGSRAQHRAIAWHGGADLWGVDIS